MTLACPDFARDGFQLIPCVLSADEVATVTAAIESADHAHGRLRGVEQFAIRRLSEAVPSIAELATHPGISQIVHHAIGQDARLVRSILFDKTPGANWAVPPHQDTTIAVRERIGTPGFDPWSVKAGVPHVQPPRGVLDSMVTIRIHLDDCPENAGALRVIPGSHLHGILSAEQLAKLTRDARYETCPASAGDCLVMRPLLIHASKPAKAPSHRRVVHLEFADGDLPNGLQWHGG